MARARSDDFFAGGGGVVFASGAGAAFALVEGASLASGADFLFGGGAATFLGVGEGTSCRSFSTIRWLNANGSAAKNPGSGSVPRIAMKYVAIARNAP